MGNCCGSQAAASKPDAPDHAPTTVDTLKTKDDTYEHRKAKEEEHSQDIEAEYKQLMAAVDEHAKKRGEYFDKSKAAHDKGDDAAAKELSNKGKEQGKLMEEAKRKASRAMFKKVNADHPEGTCDLHGQQVEPAMNLLESFIADMKAKGLKEVTIITGAGNHSDFHGPKIKPKVHEFLKKKGMPFEEVNNGSVKATI
ncbi:hypothetical protein SARC_08681 [Sphaeroforma arctica JP610]|uniref:Smr domain-containing protein n=1 Tax=Sphaeroforma arctica JP610 TaxID=667725 RepID=A0A0L0FQ19_9EUKA|nr:hypothetical protein SARC_08681 [Sphaeroforma arctica JP610]KNC78905.1 hypothetical protein SARC_08681 [Sphaeroforma arctica JP610]|eukprot:XP_014152807.1 hypothetical protein SARC_08681 [Sphaeroforma arctica JP610]